jgi:N-glycosylase/DNA lyase
LPSIEGREIEHAWVTCADLFTAAIAPATEPSESCFQRELLFCLLGGFGIAFELAVSAFDVIDGLDPFGEQWSETDLAARVERELRKAQFEPRTATGALRRYRFPSHKARVIARSSGWVRSTGPVLARLTQITDEHQRREFLEQCPGVGPKTGSWILRNLGLASTLAILDVHVLRALEACGRVTAPSLPRDYLVVEQAFIAWCSELGAPPAAFDLFLWEWQRGTLHAPAI